MRPFSKTKRVITDVEKRTMREQAQNSAARMRQSEAEKERLVAEGKLRKIVEHPNPKTTIIRYEPID